MVNLRWYPSAPQVLLGTALTNPSGSSLLPVPTGPRETKPHCGSISCSVARFPSVTSSGLHSQPWKFQSIIQIHQNLYFFSEIASQFPPVFNLSASAGDRAGAMEGSVVYHLLSPPVPLRWAGLHVAKQMSTVSHCSSTNSVCPGIVSR